MQYKNKKVAKKLLFLVILRYTIIKLDKWDKKGESRMKLSEEEIKKLGIFLQNKRKNLNYTLDDIKQKLEELGQSANTSDVLRIERGERKTPNAILLKNLCKIYGIDVISLFQEIGYLDPERIKTSKIKVYDKLATAFVDPENYLEEIDLNLNGEIIAIKTLKGIILIAKNKNVDNNQNGVFQIEGEYYIRKKSMITSTDFILLDEGSETPIFLNKESDFKELGKVIGKIIYE